MSSAAPGTPPPAPSETESVSREELDQLRARLDEFAASADRLAQAETQAETERRERETREAAERVERTAERIGLSPADVGEVRRWIREETKEAIREALDEAAVIRHEETPATSLAELQDDPNRQPPPAPTEPPAAPPPPEKPPEKPHWFHRPMGGQETTDGDA